MVKLQNGKIYVIICNKTGLKYYGSTTISLSMRLSIHKYMMNKTTNNLSSFEVLKNNDYKIELVENFPCQSKDDLFEREKYYIQNNECTNKRIPSRGIKEWYNDNKNEILQQKKEYYQSNKEILKQKSLDRYYKKKDQQQHQPQTQ